MYGNNPTQQGGMTVGTATPEKQRSLRWLWITLGALAGLLVVGGGAGAFALAQYNAPASAASQFCTDLKTQNYDTAYTMLSAKLKAAYNSDQFHQANGALDAAEGKVTACGAASGSGSYDYSLGGSTATVSAVVTRDKQGNLQGGIHLVNESDGWKVDRLDTSLLGVNLGALGTLGAFCAAMQAQNYTTAFGLFSSTPGVTAATFASAQQLQDQVDGKVTACAIKSIPSGNTDTTTTVTVTVTRATLGAGTGNISLDGTGGAWKISKIDQSVKGTDVGPLLTGKQLCDALATANYPVAYSQFSTSFQQVISQADFTQLFMALLTHVQADAKWTGCTPDLTTYQVSGTKAQYTNRFNLASATGVALGDYKLVLVFVKEGDAWKIDDLK